MRNAPQGKALIDRTLLGIIIHRRNACTQRERERERERERKRQEGITDRHICICKYATPAGKFTPDGPLSAHSKRGRAVSGACLDVSISKTKSYTAAGNL